MVVAARANAIPQRALTDCLALKMRWDNYISKSQLAEDAKRKAIAYYLTFSDQSEGERWYSKEDPDCCTHPDEFIYWSRRYEKEENKAYHMVEKIHHLIVQRYLPYTSDELERMYQYRRARGYEGAKYLAWRYLPQNHPDKKGRSRWLDEQRYPEREIRDFCKLVTSNL